MQYCLQNKPKPAARNVHYSIQPCRPCMSKCVYIIFLKSLRTASYTVECTILQQSGNQHFVCGRANLARPSNISWQEIFNYFKRLPTSWSQEAEC